MENNTQPTTEQPTPEGPVVEPTPAVVENTDVLAKQAENKPPFVTDVIEVPLNRTGKGGFGEHPENINKNGRPPRGWTWADLFEEAVEEMETDEKGVSPENAKQIKKKIAKKLIELGLDGDVSALKELFNRMDGLPRIAVAVSGSVDTGTEKVAELLQFIYEQYDKLRPSDQEASGDVLQKP